MTDYTKLSAELGSLVTSKQAQYGDSVSKSGRILEILYPDGVQPHQYQDALLVVRILDKLSRIAQRGPDGQDLGGESPYRDIAGYGLLGASKDEAVPTKGASPMDYLDAESFTIPFLAYWDVFGPTGWILRRDVSDSEIARIRKTGGLVWYCVRIRPDTSPVECEASTVEQAINSILDQIDWPEWKKSARLPSV